MVPDASTSYETSSWAATQAPYGYEGFPVDRQYPSPGPPMGSPRPGYMAPRVPIPMHAQVMYDTYGKTLPYPPIHDVPTPVQTSYYPSSHIAPPVMAESSGGWHPHHQPPYNPAFGPVQHPVVPHYPPTGYEPYGMPHYQPCPQNSWPGPVPGPSPAPHHSQPSSSRTKLAAFARPKSPRQAQADKAKADGELSHLKAGQMRSVN